MSALEAVLEEASCLANELLTRLHCPIRFRPCVKQIGNRCGYHALRNALTSLNYPCHGLLENVSSELKWPIDIDSKELEQVLFKEYAEAKKQILVVESMSCILPCHDSEQMSKQDFESFTGAIREHLLLWKHDRCAFLVNTHKTKRGDPLQAQGVFHWVCFTVTRGAECDIYDSLLSKQNSLLLQAAQALLKLI